MSNICCACYKCCYNKESACSVDAIAVDKQGRCTLKRFLKSSKSCCLDLDAFPTLHSKQILNESASEAYKEFARRLKCGVPQETGVIRCSDVDNLLKEMEAKKE